MDAAIHYGVILHSANEADITVEKQGNLLVLPASPNASQVASDRIRVRRKSSRFDTKMPFSQATAQTPFE